MQESIRIGKTSALISFAIGTVLFVVFTFGFQSITLACVGFIYIVLAFIINFFILIHLIYLAIYNKDERIELIKTCGILLLNIPITIGYFYLILIFID